MLGPEREAMLSAVSPGAELWQRLRASGGELALAFGSLLVAGSVALILGSVLGDLLSGAAARLLGFVVGPSVTAVGALLYHAAIRGLDEFAGLRIVSEPSDDWQRRPFAEAMLVVALGVLAAIGGSFLLSHLMIWLGLPIEEQPGIVAIIEDAKRTGEWLALAVLAGSAVGLAPWAEEWLFRGLLFRRIAAQARWPEAFLVSGLAFAMIHGNASGFVIYLWLGIVFAMTYRWSGRLWAAVLVHAANNLMALVGLVFFES